MIHPYFQCFSCGSAFEKYALACSGGKLCTGKSAFAVRFFLHIFTSSLKFQLYYFLIKRFKQMSAENFAEQGGGRRNPVGFRGRQRSYAEFTATDVKDNMK